MVAEDAVAAAWPLSLGRTGKSRAHAGIALLQYLFQMRSLGAGWRRCRCCSSIVSALRVAKEVAELEVGRLREGGRIVVIIGRGDKCTLDVRGRATSVNFQETVTALSIRATTVDRFDSICASQWINISQPGRHRSRNIFHTGEPTVVLTDPHRAFVDILSAEIGNLSLSFDAPESPPHTPALYRSAIADIATSRDNDYGDDDGVSEAALIRIHCETPMGYTIQGWVIEVNTWLFCDAGHRAIHFDFMVGLLEELRRYVVIWDNNKAWRCDSDDNKEGDEGGVDTIAVLLWAPFCVAYLAPGLKSTPRHAKIEHNDFMISKVAKYKTALL
ncbi:hypothetical protein BJ912DRAFT_934034 [Pholiota molesta]|nr:hypothetical protein BJ912DRAFT_934034 [Pholiota molesta]